MGNEGPDVAAALRRSRVFKALDDQELAKVAALVRIESRKRGDVLIEEDGEGSSCYVLVAGRIEVEIARPFGDGGAQRLATIRPGDVLGELSLIDGYRRSATARVAEDSELLVLDQAKLRALMEQDPAIGFKVMSELARVLATRMRDMNLKLRNAISDLMLY